MRAPQRPGSPPGSLLRSLPGLLPSRWCVLLATAGLCGYAPRPITALAATAPGAAPHHHAAHAAARTPTGAAHAALLRAQAAHAALANRQQAQAAAVQASARAQALAASRAAQAAAKAHALASVSAADRAALSHTSTQRDAVAARIASLRASQGLLEAEIATNEATLRALAPVMLRVAAHPNATLLASTGTMHDTVRGLTAVSGLAMLGSRAARTLDDRRADLDRTDRELAAQSAQLAVLEGTQSRTASLAARSARTALRTKIADDDALARARSAAAAAVAQAASLSAALARIDADVRAAQLQAQEEARAAQAARQPARAARAHERAQSLARDLSGTAGPGLAGHGGVAPVAGPVLTSFGQATEAGPASGITYAAQPGAAVRAPCAGAVEFAGPFRSFGQMLILDCGRGYRFVIAGMGTIAAGSGAQVGRGSTLGAMGAGNGAGDGGRPILFVQLRQGAGSVDPSPFF